MEFLDPFDKYFGIVACLLAAAIVEIKGMDMVKKNKNTSVRLWDFFKVNYRNLTFYEYFRAFNPLYFGSNNIRKRILILTFLLVLILIQILL